MTPSRAPHAREDELVESSGDDHALPHDNPEKPGEDLRRPPRLARAPRHRLAPSSRTVIPWNAVVRIEANRIIVNDDAAR